MCNTTTGISAPANTIEELLEYCSTANNLENGGKPCIKIVKYENTDWRGCTSKKEGQEPSETIAYIE